MNSSKSNISILLETLEPPAPSPMRVGGVTGPPRMLRHIRHTEMVGLNSRGPVESMLLYVICWRQACLTHITTKRGKSQKTTAICPTVQRPQLFWDLRQSGWHQLFLLNPHPSTCSRTHLLSNGCWFLEPPHPTGEGCAVAVFLLTHQWFVLCCQGRRPLTSLIMALQRTLCRVSNYGSAVAL